MMKVLSRLLCLVLCLPLLTMGQEKITWEKDGSEMALIPAGSFEMGDAMNEPEDWMKRSRPVHTVELDGFYMDVHEVTVGQFKEFVSKSGYDYDFDEVHRNIPNTLAEYSPGDEHPMVYVNWNDAMAYAKWARKRLPTEAEWEYAARGGLVGKRYPLGNQITHDDANYMGTDGKDVWIHTAPVGSFKANGYGLYDMAGNASELCSDWYDENYYSASPTKNPKGPTKPTNGTFHVMRGGNWRNSTGNSRVSSRALIAGLTERSSHFGFRCVSGLANSVRFTALPLGATESTATSLEMYVGKPELPASTNSTTTVTIELLNKDGVYIKGDVVNLTVDKGTIKTPAVDNGDGTYTSTYTAANVSGTAKITALTATGQFAASTINLLEIRLSLSTPANQIDAGTTMDLALTVKDSKGNAVAGEAVELVADQGTVKLIDKGSGNYTAQYTALEVGGSANITATTTSGQSQSLNLKVVDVSKDKSSIKAVGKVALQTGEEGKVEVTVISPSGKPLPGRKVWLTADPVGRFDVKSSTETDANGVATITFMAGRAGARVLRAYVSGVELDASLAFMFAGEEFDQSKWIELSVDVKWEKDGSFMSLIPAGSFEMGDHFDGMSNALVHTVELDAFYMNIHEVTVGQFKQFVQESGYAYNDWKSLSEYSPTDDHPMVGVKWTDAAAYCEWVGKRLPTEAEWEYAARGGLKNQRYPWGNDETVAREYANYRGVEGKDKWDRENAPVGSCDSNGYGLYDMAGNVWEWCADWYAEDYYASSPLTNPQGPNTDSRPLMSNRILRGGNTYSGMGELRVGYRKSFTAEGATGWGNGFRCVVSDLSTNILGPRPKIDIENKQVDFGSIDIGSNLTKQIAITNTGEAELTISAITSDIKDFTITKLPFDGEVAINQSGKLKIQFYPRSEGEISGKVTIKSNAGFETITVKGTGVITSAEKSYKASLTKGLNFISLPLQPEIPITAKSLSAELGATVLIKLDKQSKEFVSYVPEVFDSFNFTLEGAEGYIVNVMKDQEITFNGKAWDNTVAAPSNLDQISSVTWAFTVVIDNPQTTNQASIIRNLRTGQTISTSTLSSADLSSIQRQAVSLVDQSRQPVVEAGDQIEVNVGNSRWRYQLNQSELERAYVHLDLAQMTSLPNQTQLLQNYPNPFNPETWIPFELSQDAEVRLTVYDVAGQQVRKIDLGHQQAGNYVESSKAIYWDGRTEDGEQVSSGTYFYQIEAGDYTETRKMVILK